MAVCQLNRERDFLPRGRNAVTNEPPRARPDNLATVVLYSVWCRSHTGRGNLADSTRLLRDATPRRYSTRRMLNRRVQPVFCLEGRESPMKRLSFALALTLAFALPVFAQLQGGNITGTIKDEQGGVLPGVLVTLQGVDATQTFTTESTGEFRFLNLAPGRYKLTAALAGFSTRVREDLIVVVGRNVDLPITLPVAAVAETLTVIGESPIVDTKTTGTATNFTSDELNVIPTSRDPWALLRTVPGVMVDRVNIAGNETGQQSNFQSKGTRPADAVWTLDGVVITDMAAIGASPTYFNYSNFQEIQVATSGQDIRQPTGGVGLNFVVKRGTK